MIFGSALHATVFQPNLFDSEFAATPSDHNPYTKAGKAWKAAQESKGKAVISHKDLGILKEMREVIFSHKTAGELLQNGEPELSGFWYDPDHPELLCRLRTDWINTEKRAVVDLKSCIDAREWKFERDAYSLNYHMQAGWYLYGLSRITKIEHNDFYFIAQEKAPPYAVQVYHADPEMINEGLIQCQKAVQVYLECEASNRWPAYDDDVKILNLPGWVRRKEDVALYDLT